jgi:hypothetical protein
MVAPNKPILAFTVLVLALTILPANVPRCRAVELCQMFRFGDKLTTTGL